MLPALFFCLIVGRIILVFRNTQFSLWVIGRGPNPRLFMKIYHKHPRRKFVWRVCNLFLWTFDDMFIGMREYIGGWALLPYREVRKDNLKRVIDE